MPDANASNSEGRKSIKKVAAEGLETVNHDGTTVKPTTK